MIKPLASFIVLLMSIVFGFLYVLPEYKLNQKLLADSDALSQTIASFGNIETLIDKTKKNLNDIDPGKLARFKVFLPERIDSVRLANNIQSVGMRNQVALTDIKVEQPLTNSNEQSSSARPAGATQGLVKTFSLEDENAVGGTSRVTKGIPSPAAKYATTKVTISFTSTYEAAQTLLRDLEKSLGLINITALSFEPLQENTNSKKSKSVAPVNYKYTAELETYSLK